jgi:peroxiredoxin
LIELLIGTQSWDEFGTLASPGHLESAEPEIQIRRAHALGLGHFARQDTEGLATQLQALRQLARQLPVASGGDSTRRKLEPLVKSSLAELERCEQTARGEQPAVASRLSSNRGASETPVVNESERKTPRQEAGAEVGTAAIWEPLSAPALVLPDRHGNNISLSSFRGKPVVLVFYLGAGCPHCITQLQSFAPLREDYEKAGITVIAISSDSVAGLKETFRVAGAGDAIPFLLVSDQKLETFGEFGAFDPVEKKALHGTFLVDARGRILWRNVRREPFMETRQLLTEAMRVGKLDESASRGSTPFASGSQ